MLPPDPHLDDLRHLLDSGDRDGLAALLARHPELTTTEVSHWPDHPLGVTPLSYVAMLRFDTTHQLWRDDPAAADLARVLLARGAPVNGLPGCSETPLITAASYGAAGVAAVLVESGADLEARAADDAGGVPGGTALLHAVVFGMTDVVDVLAHAGARVPDLVQAAAVGDLHDVRLEDATATDRVLALIAAAHHQRLDVIDALVAAGTPVDAVDPLWGPPPAAAGGRGRATRECAPTARPWRRPGGTRRTGPHRARPVPLRSRTSRR